MTKSRRNLLVGLALGLVTGWLFAEKAGALLMGVGGLILGWAVNKGAVFHAVRGAVIGAFFLSLVGPGADWIISGASPGSQLYQALVIGALVGALLGVRNARKPKSERVSVAGEPSANLE